MSRLLATFIYRFRYPLTALCIAGALLFAPRANITRIDNDITAWFSKDDPVYRDYERFREGVFLRYLDAEAGPMRRVPQLGLSFGDRMYRADLDSGSTGVVVAAAWPPLQAPPARCSSAPSSALGKSGA